jgi:hypothetical protein
VDPVLYAPQVEARVWSAVMELLYNPDLLLSLAGDYLQLRADDGDAGRDLLAETDRQIAGLERTLTETVGEYLRAGLPASAVKAAADKVEDELAALRSHRVWLAAQQDDAQAESERMRDVWALAERAADVLREPTPARAAEVLRLLDVRVTVLDGSNAPRLG